MTQPYATHVRPRREPRRHSIDAVFSFLVEYLTAHRGRPPTTREIGDHFAIRSTSTVRNLLRRLARQGRLDLFPGARGIEIPNSQWLYTGPTDSKGAALK